MATETRRTFLKRAGHGVAAGTILGTLAGRAHAGPVAPAGGRDADAPTLFAYVGCFTSAERKGRGHGISVYQVDRGTWRWTPLQVLEGEVNPSFLVRDPHRSCLYASHTDGGQVSAYRVDPSGRIALINRQPTGGINVAHVTLAPSGRFLVAANYLGGSVAVVPVAPDGALGARTDLVEMKGDIGPHRVEQAASHPHQCRFDRGGRVLVVPDKGLDRIFRFALDESGTLRPLDPPWAVARPGAGPRHVAFHPTAPFAFVVNELDSTVMTYRVDEAGAWSPVQVLSTLPSSFTGVNTAAAVELSLTGDLAFVSNRGHDSIVTFTIDTPAGTLASPRWTASRGRTPRFLCLDPAGEHVCVANQASDTIASFRIEPRTGDLVPDGDPMDTGSPTGIAFGTRP